MTEETNLPTDVAPHDKATRDGDLAGTARDVGSAAKERLHDLRDAAQSSLEDVKSAAADKTDELKGQTADEIARTARGLEAAADQLEGSPLQQDLLREAADGLKQIARAVQGKSIGAMVGELSEFGRQNPLAYLGGAALAGFALARFARASSPDDAARYPASTRPEASTDPADRARSAQWCRRPLPSSPGGRKMPEDRSTPALMGDLIESVTQLVRKEIQLFRAEMGEKATQAMVAAGSILAAGVIALTALNVLAAALVAALAKAGIPGAWSAVIVGGVLAIIAYVLARKGINDLKAGSLAPERTARAAARDATMVKEKI